MNHEVQVVVGVDMAKTDHYAQAIHVDGTELFSRSVLNDEPAIRSLIEKASAHGRCALVIDMTASGAQLLLSVAASVDTPVAYVTGLQMRRAAELYAGTAKTDPIDAWVLADFARRNFDRLTWLDVGDELLLRLRVLNGRDTDLATDTNRTVNRCRDAMVAVSPALERAVGDRLHQPGVRDVIATWPTTTALRSTGKTKIRNRIKKRSTRLANKVADEIWTAIEAQTVVLPAEETWGEVIVDHRRSGRSLNSASQTRGGNHRLKNSMFIAAFVATQHDPLAKAYYQRKRDEGKRHNAAVICVARRRCDLILAMLKQEKPYDPRINGKLPVAA